MYGVIEPGSSSPVPLSKIKLVLIICVDAVCPPLIHREMLLIDGAFVQRRLYQARQIDLSKAATMHIRAYERT
jgi:hypothetical protein